MFRIAKYNWFHVAVLAAAMFTVANLLYSTEAAADTTLKNGVWTDDVLVYYQDAKGWHWRRSKVVHVKDASVAFCVQIMPSPTGTCFYNDGDETAAVESSFPWEVIT